MENHGQPIMSLKRNRVFVRFMSELQDFISDIIFLENNLVSSDLRLVFRILRQMNNFNKQGRLTGAIRLGLIP